MTTPTFLTLGEVLDLHDEQIEHFGGAPGVRDVGLLDSAISQPSASTFGSTLHEDLFQQAAGYIFHIIRNHPFADGNKRTGVFAAFVFLDINEVEIDVDPDELAEMGIAVAAGRATKDEIARFLRRGTG